MTLEREQESVRNPLSLDEMPPDIVKTPMKTWISILDAQIKKKEAEIAAAPEGTIWIYYRKTKHPQLYWKRPGRHEVYLGKKQRKLISQLAQKQYDIDLCRRLKKQRSILQNATRCYQPEELDALFPSEHPALQQWIKPIRVEKEQLARMWETQLITGPRLGFAAEAAILETDFGLRVRSKSEAMIAERLKKHGIPFVYEFPLGFGKAETLHPDFYCLNLQTRQVVIWEHFGMIDNAVYFETVVSKIKRYRMSDVCQDMNLIFTMETKKQPLSSAWIEREIQRVLI